MSRISTEKPIFSEVFYRSEKKYMEKMRVYILVGIFATFIAVIVVVLVMVYLVIGGNYTFSKLLLSPLSSALFLSIFALIVGYHLLNILRYIIISNQGLKIIVGNKKVKKEIPKEEIRKVVINLRNKRVEIYLKNGKVLYSKRYDRRRMEHDFVYHDQFERFKKAMKEIGAEYEVIYP